MEGQEKYLRSEYTYVRTLEQSKVRTFGRTFGPSNVGTFERWNLRTSEFSNVRTFERSSVRTFERSNVQTFECSNVRTFERSKRSNVQTFERSKRSNVRSRCFAFGKRDSMIRTLCQNHRRRQGMQRSVPPGIERFRTRVRLLRDLE